VLSFLCLIHCVVWVIGCIVLSFLCLIHCVVWVIGCSLIHCVVLVIGCSRSQAINYGSASELYFSQHDVMRDLALYLASRGSIVRRKTLLMPKKEDSLPGKWKLLKDQVFDAQIVSKQISMYAPSKAVKITYLCIWSQKNCIWEFLCLFFLVLVFHANQEV
jgi:hypothetical protein